MQNCKKIKLTIHKHDKTKYNLVKFSIFHTQLQQAEESVSGDADERGVGMQANEV